MIVIFRRLAGLTRRPRKRRSLHRSPIGTSVGALVSAMGSPAVNSSRGMPGESLVDQTEEDGEGNEQEPEGEDRGDRGRGVVDGHLTTSVALPQGLRGAPDAVPQVHADQDDGDG